MTYQEMLDTRADRQLAADKRKEEWLKNVDLDQLEIDQGELDDFLALAG